MTTNHKTLWYRRPVVAGPVAVAVAVVLAAAAAWFLFVRDPTPAISDDGAQQIAAGFLADIRAGKADDAWANTSTDFKSMSGREVFRRYAKSKPVMKEPAEFVGCTFKTEGQLRLAECTFRPAGGKGTITVVLHPEGGSWKVGKLTAE